MKPLTFPPSVSATGFLNGHHTKSKFHAVSLFETFFLSCILFCASATLPVSAQLPPQISEEIKSMQIESRKTDPIGIFTKFSITSAILPLDLDELGDRKLENRSDARQTTDLEAIRKAYDRDMKASQDKLDFRREAIPVLFEIGKRIVAAAVTKYPEIVSTSDGGPQLPPGKSGSIIFFLKEGIIDGKRLMLIQIHVSGYLSVKNQPDMQFCNVYFRQTPVGDLSDVHDSCEKLLKQFYADYTAARSARVLDINQ